MKTPKQLRDSYRMVGFSMVGLVIIVISLIIFENICQ
jgi:hypothetical protein